MTKLPFFVRVAEDLGDVAAGGQADRGMVRRHGLDRERARRLSACSCAQAAYSGVAGFGAALEHQGRQDLQVGVERLPVQGLGQGGRQARLGLLVREARVGGAQLQVGDQAVELPVAAGDDDEGAFLHFLRGDGQPGAEGFFQSAADDIANRFDSDCYHSHIFHHQERYDTRIFIHSLPDKEQFRALYLRRSSCACSFPQRRPGRPGRRRAGRVPHGKVNSPPRIL